MITPCRVVKVFANISKDYMDYIPVKKKDMIESLKGMPAQSGVGYSDIEVRVVTVREHGVLTAYVN